MVLNLHRSQGVDCTCHTGLDMVIRSQARVNGWYSEVLGVGVGVHQGSVLHPLV